MRAGRETGPAPRAVRLAWCLFDFANSGFPTVIVTALYVLWFKKVVVGAETKAASHAGDLYWGLANAGAGLCVFLAAPLLGALADLGGWKRRFLIGSSLGCILATSLLPLAGPGRVMAAALLFLLATAFFEASLVFYNAFLPLLVPRGGIARLSGLGWGLGYFGGLGCLLACLPLVRGGEAADLRPAPWIVAAWFLLFAFPSFALLRDEKPAGGTRAGFGTAWMRLRRTLGDLRREGGPLPRFLAAFFFYNNAVLAILAFTVDFTDHSLGFGLEENLVLIVVLNLAAAPGAVFFGRLATRIGTLRTLRLTLRLWLLALAGAILAAWPGLFSTEGAKTFFWGVAGLASLCIGAVQATSRSFLSLLAPPGRSAETFGLMAFAGKASGVLGPLVFGLVSVWAQDQRAAVGSLGLFFLAGLLLLGPMKEPAGPCGSVPPDPRELPG